MPERERPWSRWCWWLFEIRNGENWVGQLRKWTFGFERISHFLFGNWISLFHLQKGQFILLSASAGKNENCMHFFQLDSSQENYDLPENATCNSSSVHKIRSILDSFRLPYHSHWQLPAFSWVGLGMDRTPLCQLQSCIVLHTIKQWTFVRIFHLAFEWLVRMETFELFQWSSFSFFGSLETGPLW